MKEARVVNCYLDPVVDCSSTCPFYPEMKDRAETIANERNVTFDEAVEGIRKAHASLDANLTSSRIASTLDFLKKQRISDECANLPEVMKRFNSL